MAKSTKSTETEILQNIVEAAILAAEGIEQSEIARALGPTQGTISRRLKEARKRGLLGEAPPSPPPPLHKELIPEDILARAQEAINFSALRNQLVERLNAIARMDIVHTVSIVRTAKRNQDPQFDNWRGRLKVVCQSAASHLPYLLSRAKKVGVAWGHTLRYLVDELGDFTPQKKPPIIFPIVGSFPYSEEPYPIELTSTRIATDLAEILNGEIPKNQVSLDAIPAFIPPRFDRSPIEEFFSTLPGFREVFGGPSPRDVERFPDALLNSVDFLITGLGAMPAPDKAKGSPALRARLVHEDANLQKLSEISVGDIGGVLLPKYGIKDADRELVIGEDGINKRFIGVGLEDFQDCARKYYDSKGTKPGVLAIAHDKWKAAAVVEAVRYRCVNHLFIDKDLADTLIDLL